MLGACQQNGKETAHEIKDSNKGQIIRNGNIPECVAVMGCNTQSGSGGRVHMGGIPCVALGSGRERLISV